MTEADVTITTNDQAGITASYSIQRIGHAAQSTPPTATDVAQMLFGELIVNLDRGKDELYEWATCCAEEINQVFAELSALSNTGEPT